VARVMDVFGVFGVCRIFIGLYPMKAQSRV
jgi:hypothetical protein